MTKVSVRVQIKSKTKDLLEFNIWKLIKLYFSVQNFMDPPGKCIQEVFKIEIVAWDKFLNTGFNRFSLIFKSYKDYTPQSINHSQLVSDDDATMFNKLWLCFI